MSYLLKVIVMMNMRIWARDDRLDTRDNLFPSLGDAELVQATNENIREYQEAVEEVTTEEIANFTSGLTVAFELLKASRTDTEMGANCNQAIMIVTDGVPYKYEEIFKTYNFPHKNVRYGG